MSRARLALAAVAAAVAVIVTGWLALVFGFVALVHVERWVRIRRGEDVR